MKILQLCIFTNHWGKWFDVDSYDIVNGKDVFELSDNIGKCYDFILSAPPCTQFTKVNNKNWLEYPEYDIKLVRKCLRISLLSHKPFVLENPPGRITNLVPELEYIRLFNLNDSNTNKEWILYGNVKIPFSPGSRYGRKSVCDFNKLNRLAYPPFFIERMREIFFFNT